MIKRHANGKPGCCQSVGSRSTIVYGIERGAAKIRTGGTPGLWRSETADGRTSTAAWLAVLLLGTGWILDRIYLSK